MFVLLTLAAPAQQAQARPSEEETAEAAVNDLGPSGIVPLDNGLNASLITAIQHDSSSGWSGPLTPALAYRFNRYLAVDASSTIYVSLNVLPATTAKTVAAANKLATKHLIAGDTVLAGHLSLPATERVNYTFTPSLAMPSGNSVLGIGAGQVTYDFNNHMEMDTRFAPFAEAGIGDTSTLVNRRVRRGQNSVGTLAHFQIGGSLEFFELASLDLNAYELLPIGDQNIYATSVVKKRTVTRVTGTTGLAEDNGFNTSLDIPLNEHTVISGFYNRSLRQHTDTAGFALTLLARGGKHSR